MRNTLVHTSIELSSYRDCATDKTDLTAFGLYGYSAENLYALSFPLSPKKTHRKMKTRKMLLNKPVKHAFNNRTFIVL